MIKHSKHISNFFLEKLSSSANKKIYFEHSFLYVYHLINNFFFVFTYTATLKMRALDMEDLISENITFNDMYIDLPKEYLREVAKNSSKIVVQALKLLKDPFSWSPQQVKASTDVLSLNVYTGIFNETKTTKHNITISFDLKNPILPKHIRQGYVLPQNDMPRYEILLDPHTTLILDFYTTNEDIKIRFKPGNRTMGYSMINDTILINSTNPRRKFALKNFGSKAQTVFLAVIPADICETKVINFSFSLQSRKCQTFGRFSDRWEPFEEFQSQSMANYINCSVNHLSSFKASVVVEPNHLHTNRDYIILLSTNYVVIIFVIILLVIFTCLLVYAAYLDKGAKRFIIFTTLPNEKGEEEFTYLITVITGKFVINVLTCS